MEEEDLCPTPTPTDGGEESSVDVIADKQGYVFRCATDSGRPLPAHLFGADLTLFVLVVKTPSRQEVANGKHCNS